MSSFILSLLPQEMATKIAIHSLYSFGKNGHASILSYTGHKDVTAIISFYCLSVVKVLFCHLTKWVNPKISIVCPKLTKRSF